MEIEKKFLINQKQLFEKVDLIKCEKFYLEQIYISIDETEVRMRKVTDNIGKCNYFMTIKSKGNLIRNEVEFEIPCCSYNEIINNGMYLGRKIIKSRYKVPLSNNLIAELDFYEDGLITVEVEFDKIEEADKFIKPKWFSIEITTDMSYKNRNLIKEGFKDRKININ